LSSTVTQKEKHYRIKKKHTTSFQTKVIQAIYQYIQQPEEDEEERERKEGKYRLA